MSNQKQYEDAHADIAEASKQSGVISDVFP